MQVLSDFLPGFKEHAAAESSATPQSTAPVNGNGSQEEVRRPNGPI